MFLGLLVGDDISYTLVKDSPLAVLCEGLLRRGNESKETRVVSVEMKRNG